MTRSEIAERLLGAALVDGEFAPCPGRALHHNADGARDFRVVLVGAPTGYCFHKSCADAVAVWNLELRRAIWREENPGRWSPEQASGLGQPGDGVAREPRGVAQKAPPLDTTMLRRVAGTAPAGVDADWFRRRSPVDPAGLSPGGFLDALYEPDERVLVFTRQFSQGDFLWEAGVGGYRLSQERGVRATRSALPGRGIGPDGVWFLTQPVTGTWQVNARLNNAGQVKYSRRSEESVTCWRNFLLENDEAPMDLWLRALSVLPLPVSAIYTSGGRSVHALVRWPQPSKRAWDLARDTLVRPMMCPLGADPAALSAVRLSRLPGCFRGENEQRLLYVNPSPRAVEIVHLKEMR